MQKLVGNAVWGEKKSQNGSETRVDIMIVLRSTQPSTNRYKSGPGTSFHQPYYPISFLIKAAFEQDIEVVEAI